jgi:hypothetical protein
MHGYTGRRLCISAAHLDDERLQLLRIDSVSYTRAYHGTKGRLDGDRLGGSVAATAACGET